ncbi:MAG: M20/M25/M40 family metallo-hydrolase [Rhodothermaceae bacterium]|nr:M20/M25/M40 family metallo-hydrolase [Rhodothermaceae bacterium]
MTTSTRTLIALALLYFCLPIQVSVSQNQSLQQLEVDVIYLSSDYLEGRETGTDGEEKAALYIASRFENLGLKPMGTDGWMQSFDFKYSSNPHAAPGSGDSRTGTNVIGMLDNGAEHTVVIGAHYDHLGHGSFGSRQPGDMAIHNGADDNASGVAGILAIAEGLKASSARNNNYLFIGFSGEELGLYGSKYFVKNPTVEREQVNYMINLDMVGRLNEEGVLAVNGTGTSPLWDTVLEKAKPASIDVKKHESGVGASDHTSFYLEGMPVLHFFTGQHQDYHKASDDSELINYQGIHEISSYIVAIIEQLDEEGKLEFVKTKDENQRMASSFKVTMGIMPDYVSDGVGVRIDAVMENRPAANAGLEGGDIIRKIGDLDINNINDYMGALGKFEKGQKTTVVVKRGDKMVEKELVF